MDELDETVKPHVLDETFTVLSIGRRCMKMGYAFHIPYLVSDGGVTDIALQSMTPRDTSQRFWHWSRTMSQTRAMMKMIYLPLPVIRRG